MLKVFESSFLSTLYWLFFFFPFFFILEALEKKRHGWGVFDYQIKQWSVGADGSDSRRQKDHAEALEPQNGEVEIGRPVVARLSFDFDLSS